MSADHKWQLPRFYRNLFTFYMPELPRDESKNRTTAVWTGKDPPEHPLAYAYRDPTIIDRVLSGLRQYLEANEYWDKALPDKATDSWAELQDHYYSSYERESWLRPVSGFLCSLLRRLMIDLNLGSGVVSTDPSRQFRQEGNVDWLILQNVPANENERRNIMIEELTNPQSPPKIGGGSAIEFKLTGVLDNYRAEYFSVPHRAFIPSNTPHVKGDAILFKLDLQMCHRIYNKVSSRAPRFGLVYSGHKCVVVENLHPLVPAEPFEPEKHNHGPPTSVPHPSMTLGHRGAGQSDVHALVPSCADTNCRLVPFLALLIAINAPPGMLTFEDPDSALALAAYNNYLDILSAPPLPTPPSPKVGGSGGGGGGGGGGGSSGGGSGGGGSGSGVGKGKGGKNKSLNLEVSYPDSESLTLVLSPPFSQRPQQLTKVARSQIEEGISYARSLHPKCSSVVLSLRTILPSGPHTTVHRGTLNHETPVVAKLYDVGSGYEALLRELDAYECMEGLECVPKCLGVYAPVHRAWAALLLEDKGDPLGNNEWKDLDLNLEERWAIYGAVEKIHAAGVVHGDLEARNVVRDEDDDFYVIDFGHSSVDHQCEPQTSWCSELRSLWDDLDLDDP